MEIRLVGSSLSVNLDIIIIKHTTSTIKTMNRGPFSTHSTNIKLNPTQCVQVTSNDRCTTRLCFVNSPIYARSWSRVSPGGMTVGMPGMMVFWSGVSLLQRLLFRDFFWPKSVREETTHNTPLAEVHRVCIILQITLATRHVDRICALPG